MVSIKEMKETIKQAGLPLADLIERADVEERYGDALARLGEADELKARRARASEPGPDAKRPRTSADPPPATSSSRPAATPRAAEPATAKTSPPAAATAKTPPPPDALAQPVAETLSHVSPAALARLAQTSRAWREAARDAGVLCVVTKMSSSNVDFLSDDGEFYGEFYEDPAQTDGPRFRLSLGWIWNESHTVPREIVAEDEDGHPYGAIDIEMSSCPLLVECSRIVHAAVAKVYKDWREPPTDFQYVARDLRDRGHHIAMGRAPRAVKILPASLLRTIARDDRPQ